MAGVRSLLAFWIGGASAAATTTTGTPEAAFQLPARGTVFQLDRGSVFKLPARGTVFTMIRK